MVDRKTGVKPKQALSRKLKAKSSDKPVKVAKSVKEDLGSEVESSAKSAAEQAEIPTSNIQPLTSKLAKAGKHSAKAIREERERQAKLQRKDGAAAEPVKPAKKPTRPRAERAGKKYHEAIKLIDKARVYSLAEAVELAASPSPTKFDATVELHINLGVDPKQADQNIRGMIALPSGSGKSLRIAIFADGPDAAKAKAAGADIVGVEAVTQLLEAEKFDFDVLIAAPTQMAQLAKYARLLGPRGLMPSPKSGTVAADVAAAVTEAKAGRVEYRIDSAGIIHLGIGKVSFGAAKLLANAEAVLTSVRAARPGSLKGDYIKSVFITTTMGPSIKVTL